MEDNLQCVMSPVLASVKMMLDDTKISAEKLIAGALYNSEVFGSALKETLKDYGFKEVLGTTVRNSEEVRKVTENADVLITAVGVPLFIKDSMIKNDAVIIDIGIAKIDDKVCGDVDPDSVKDKASFISPVPGGVGPLTIAFLFQNVLSIYKNKKTA